MQAPRDKLVCILNCCRVINNLLHVQVQQGEARGENLSKTTLPLLSSPDAGLANTTLSQCLQPQACQYFVIRRGVAAGADDFLPVLIYVVIHANPPQLASNLEYIQRFRMHSRMASESAYFFTQLVSVLLHLPQLLTSENRIVVALLSCMRCPATCQLWSWDRARIPQYGNLFSWCVNNASTRHY